MSRSIHTTRQTYLNERKNQFRDEETKESRLKSIRDDLNNKRMLKEGKLLSRKLAKLPFALMEAFDPTSIPIEEIDCSDFIHYPASKDDLYEVSKRLPLNVMVGINSINLCLGKEYQEEKWEEDPNNNYDPYTGRICSSEDGPFYCPQILGIYRPANCKIFIFAYVYDKKNKLRNQIEAFLRLKMLTTFVHEVAHHDDEMRRSGRGRWLGLTEWRCENYAEIQQGEWIQTAVIPYLLEKYPLDYEQLLKWVFENGGVSILVKYLASEPRINGAGGLISLGYDSSFAVEEMFHNIFRGKTSRDVMFDFAYDFHIADHFEECLESLSTLLSNHPVDAEAMGVKADTLIHLERYGEAEIVARDCLSIDPNNLDALEALCDIQMRNRDWYVLKETSFHGISLSEAKPWKHRRFLENNIIASLYLNDYQTAKENAKSLPDNKGRLIQRKQAFITLVAFLSGDVEKAKKITTEVMAEEHVIGPAKAIFKAVNNRIKDEFGLVENRYSFTEYERDFLSSWRIDELTSISLKEIT
jgi:hypothetical protein